MDATSRRNASKPVQQVCGVRHLAASLLSRPSILQEPLLLESLQDVVALPRRSSSGLGEVDHSPLVLGVFKELLHDPDSDRAQTLWSRHGR